MKYKLVLPIMAFMLSCNFITGLGSSSSDPVSVDLDSPADPVNVTVELNETETTSAVISPNGGELTLTSADGSVYTLEVPAGALLADTEISMTTIDTLEGGPVESNVYGVQLEPSGLAFYEFLTLTIRPAAEIPLEGQFMFKYEGNGENLHHAIVDPNTEEIRIKLLSFSGGGVGFGTKGKVDLGKLENAQLRFDDALGKLFQQARKATPAQKAAMVNVIENLLKTQSALVDKLISAAKEDCDNVNAADEAKRILDKYRNQLTVLMQPSGSSGDAGADGDDLAPLSTSDSQRIEIGQLKDECWIYKASGTWANSQLNGTFDKLDNPFTLKVSGGCTGTMTFSGGYGGAVSCNITCEGVEFKGTGDYNINPTEGGGELTGFCSTLSDAPEDQAEKDSFDVTLLRISK